MVFPYKWFSLAWAVAGTKVAPPNPTQGDGTLSYNEGFGADYSLDPATNPSALLIPRDKSNGLYYDITQALQYLQKGKFVAWIDATTNGGSAYPYDIGDTVLYTDGFIYQSLTAANVTTPGTDFTKWIIVGGASGAQNQAGNYAVDTGAANAYVITPLPALDAYRGGQIFRFAPAHINTGASTLAVSGLAAKSVVRNDGSALQAGDIPASGLVEVIYQATLGKFCLTAPANLVSLAQWTSSFGTSGWFKTPGGAIFQWFTYTITPNQTTSTLAGTQWGQGNFAFPLTWPNVVRAPMVQPQITTNGQLRWAVVQIATNPTLDIYDTNFIGGATPLTGWAFGIGN